MFFDKFMSVIAQSAAEMARGLAKYYPSCIFNQKLSIKDTVCSSIW